MPDAPDPDYDPNSATIPLSGPRPTLSGRDVDLPLPQELAKLLPAGAYEVTDFLGAGGMGAVYKGMQIRLKRPVAIKIMRRDVGKDHDFEARFEREAQAMAKLNHPNIISVIDYGEAGSDYLFIVMELVDGTDLMDVIRSKQMTQEMALTLLPQICDALQFAHDHGIVYRDIKPSNIMLTRDGRVKMADFGLAKHFDHAESGFRTQTGTGMGTPDYAAPEQFDPTTPVDHRADIYALGVMIYQMITGALPRGVWRPPSQRAPVSTQWDAVVSRAMQNDPSERYQKASEVKTELSSIPLGKEGSAGTPARPVSNVGAAAKNPEAVRSARAPVKSRAPLIFGLIAGVVVIALGAFFMMSGKKEAKQSGPLSPLSGTPSSPAAPNAAQGTVRTTLPVPALPESGWRPLFTEAEWKAKPGFKNGLLKLSHNRATKPQTWSDGAIRTRIEFRDGSSSPSLMARQEQNGFYYRFGIGSAGDHIYLAYAHLKGEDQSMLSRQFLPAALKPGNKVILELRVQGDRLTGVLDGKVVIEAQDSRLQAPGGWGIVATEGWFESVEVQTLEAAPPSVLPSPNLPVSSSPSPPSPSIQWRKAGWTAEDLKNKTIIADGGWARIGEKAGASNGWLIATGEQNVTFKDGVVRLRYRWQGSAIILKTRNEKTFGQVQLWGPHVSLGIYLNSAETRLFQQVTLPEPLKVGDEGMFEVAAIGNRLYARLNDSIVLSSPEIPELAPSGFCAIQSVNTSFRDVEYAILDGLPEAEALRLLGVDKQGQDPHRESAPVSKSSEPGAIKLWNTPAKIPKEAKVRWVDGALVLEAPQILFFEEKLSRDGIVRASFLRNAKESDRYVGVRGGRSESGRFQCYRVAPDFEKGLVVVHCELGKETKFLKDWRLPRPVEPNGWMQVELRVVGDELTVSADGQVVGTFRNSTLTEPGGVILWGHTGDAFRDIEYVPLDTPATVAPSPSPPVLQSSVATATKDAPFINTLGMKFVPVPITGGPTDKQRVLFSIWETRVHDYEVFVKGAKREWKKSGIEQGTTHPAVNMNCEDAMAFCAWLTETERKAGKLDAQFAYRLPSDHEWSCAVGIGDKEDAAKTPEEKNIQVPVFPWGNQWPPPADAGNYAGLELKPLIDSGKLMGGRTDLGEWQDSFVQTAPCGSFRESRDGLFDLGGNAFEWCDTPWSATSAGAIIRGGSSHDGQRERLFSSLRVEKSLNTTSANLGFRCVLAPTKPSLP